MRGRERALAREPHLQERLRKPRERRVAATDVRKQVQTQTGAVSWTQTNVSCKRVPRGTCSLSRAARSTCGV
eukprot:650942-Pleurochrysis_carterae.AAC.1